MLKSFKFKKWTSLAVTALMTVSILSNSINIKVKAAAGDKVFDLVEITDFHGQLLSSDATPLPVGAVLAQNVNDIRKANPDRTLVMGGGDLYQGTPISNVLKGVPVQKVMTSIGMEVTALGNHEFDWGGLNTINTVTMKDASYSIVCANLYDKTTNKRVYDPYKIITKDGVKIAVIGAITTDAPNIIMPAYVANYNFKDPITEINTVAKDIKDNHLADVIIADIHEGNDVTNSSNGPITGPIETIADGLVNVNAVFAGHSHTEVHALSAKGMPIYIAKSNGKGIIDVKMTVGANGTVSFPAPTASDYKALDTTNANGYKAANPIQDPAAKAIVDAAIKEVGPTFDEVIGNIPTDLNRKQASGVAYSESQLGNWAADVVKNNAKADIGVANNGGLRCDFAKGDVTVGMVFNFMPFDNEIDTVMVNYAQLKVILEQAVMDGGKGIQISGIKFYYDMQRPNMDRVLKITREDGTAINSTEKLKVAGPDFVLTGGDGFAGFIDPAVKASLFATHVLARDAFIADVRANKTIKVVMDNRLVSAPLAKITVVGTSDVHGNVLNWDYVADAAPSTPQGLAKVSTFVNGLRAVNPGNVMLIDNGDTIQGTPLSYYYDMIDQKSEYPMMKIFGVMGYDAWTLGNHEYNYGLTTLNRIISDAKSEGINVLSANTYNGNNSFVDPYIIRSFNVNGITKKVAVIGLTTKTIPNWEDVAHYKNDKYDLSFKDLVDEANKWVPIVKAKGADYVIISAHTGEEGATDVIPENEAKAIAEKVANVDVILAGHSHSVIPDPKGNPKNSPTLLSTIKNTTTGKDVLITEPGKNAQYVSQINISFDQSGKLYDITAAAVPMTASIADDPKVLDAIDTYQTTTKQYINTILGTSTGEYKGAGQYVVPTAIMDLINKVQMEAAGTQLSIAAPLSSSAYIPKGNVTIKDIMGVYVYENFLYGVKMTGKQVKQWMEYNARYYKQINDSTIKIDINTDYKTVKDSVLNIADYNLDQLYGATYDIDLTQPASVVDKDGNVTTWGTRIKNLRFNGKLVKDTDVFTVAINNYRFNGGGGFMKAAGLTIKDSRGVDVPNPDIVTYDSGKALGDDGQVRSLMMSYIKNHKTITPDCSNNWKLYTTAVTETADPTPTQSTNVVPAASDLSTKIAAKVKAVTGKDQNVFAFTLNNITAKTTVTVFVGTQWANKTVTLALYNKDKNIYETVLTNVKVDANGYITVDVDKAGDYFVTDATSLPKTGSPIDFNTLVDFGAFVALLGAALFVANKRRRRTAA